MGGDGTLADVINTMVLRQQRETGNDVDNPDVTVKPLSIKLGIIPAGKYKFEIFVQTFKLKLKSATLLVGRQ